MASPDVHELQPQGAHIPILCSCGQPRQKSGCFRVNLYWNRWLAVFPFRAPALVPPTKNLDECQQIRPDCGPLLIGKRAAEASSEFYASFSF